MFVIALLIYKLFAKFAHHIDRVGGNEEVENTENAINQQVQLVEKKEEVIKKLTKDNLVYYVSLIIFVLALAYPAWFSVSETGGAHNTFYGSTILFMGWFGILTLYLPAYFIIPAASILGKIRSGMINSKMLWSRWVLFLFWLEGFLGVVVFKFGGASDAGSEVVTATGPSFWMWTVLVWYILACSYMYVNFREDKIKVYVKRASIIAVALVLILAAQYHLINIIK